MALFKQNYQDYSASNAIHNVIQIIFDTIHNA